MEGKKIVFEGAEITVLFDNARRKLIGIRNANGEQVLGMFNSNQLSEIRKIVFY